MSYLPLVEKKYLTIKNSVLTFYLIIYLQKAFILTNCLKLKKESGGKSVKKKSFNFVLV